MGGNPLKATWLASTRSFSRNKPKRSRRAIDCCEANVTMLKWHVKLFERFMQIALPGHLRKDTEIPKIVFMSVLWANQKC